MAADGTPAASAPAAGTVTVDAGASRADSPDRRCNGQPGKTPSAQSNQAAHRNGLRPQSGRLLTAGARPDCDSDPAGDGSMTNTADILGTIGRAGLRLTAEIDTIRGKVKIGRQRMVEDLKTLHGCLASVAERLRANPHFAPVRETKELASQGFTLHKIVKIAVDEEEADSFADVLIRGMSSRRIVFEIEDAKDKEELQATLDQIVTIYQELIDKLSRET